MDWFLNFLIWKDHDLREFKKSVDFTIYEISLGPTVKIENFFEPF